MLLSVDNLFKSPGLGLKDEELHVEFVVSTCLIAVESAESEVFLKIDGGADSCDTPEDCVVESLEECERLW